MQNNSCYVVTCSLVSYLIFWEFHTEVLHLHHFHHPTLSPLQFTSCLPYSISNSWPLLHYCMCITYNVMSTFSVAHKHMCLGMSTWYWITYHELCPQSRQILPLLRSYWLPIPHHLVKGPCEISLSWQCQMELPLYLFCLGNHIV